MSEHTPGPWSWQKAAEPNGIHHNALIHPNTEVILYEKPTHQSCARANARLIAAAPDLLAACESALIALKTGSPKWKDTAIADLDRAIAKAEKEA